MNFSQAEKVADVIEDLKQAEQLPNRAPARALIDELFNGSPPYSAEEEKENRIQVNVNWKEGSMLLLEARQQYENAFLSTGNLFTVSVPDAPQSKATNWGGIITTQVNKVFKNSRAFLHTMREVFGELPLHGIGVEMYPDQYNPISFFVPRADILVPTDTLITLENLTHFPVRRRMTPGELFRKTLARGQNVDPGWNLDAVKRILNKFHDLNQNQNNWNWSDHAEQMAELWKQNGLYYESDATPTIWFWDFYFQEDDQADQSWHRVILLDDDCVPSRGDITSDPLDFIYQSDKPYAKNLDQLLNVQFADGNNVPPFKWHAVRSLGWLLFDVVHMMNRLRCQFTQKVFEDLMDLFHVTDPADRSRLDRIYMGLNYGIIPDGLTFVKREERYEPNAELVEQLMSNYKQLMGESSASYTQDIDQGTKKERTAFEVQALLSQTAKLTGSMLNLAYLQARFSYREKCRRLTIKDSPDFLAKRFIAACKEAGVPEKWLDSDRWEIEPERVLGQGNPTLEQAQAKGLFDIRSVLSPEGQARVTHDYVFALTHDPKRTDVIAPIDGAPHVTDSVHDTELAFAAFMSGVPVTPKSGTNPIEVVETMLRLMQQVIGAIMQGGGVGTPQQVAGLQGAEQYTGAYIQMLSQDNAMKERVTAYGKQLGKLMNFVKAMQQRQQEAAKKAQQGNGQPDPATMAKVQGAQALTQVKLRGRAAADAQKLHHAQQKFQGEQQRANLKTLNEVKNDSMKAVVGAHGKAANPVAEEGE